MRSLDRCPKCQVGRIREYRAITIGSSRKRYLKCDSCDKTGTEVVQIDELGRQVFAAPVITNFGNGENGDAPSANVG
jgi:hypothetical protein